MNSGVPLSSRVIIRGRGGGGSDSAGRGEARHSGLTTGMRSFRRIVSAPTPEGTATCARSFPQPQRARAPGPRGGCVGGAPEERRGCGPRAYSDKYS
jgi:hypothetical protein